MVYENWYRRVFSHNNVDNVTPSGESGTGPQGPPGGSGPQGPQGAQGHEGPQGVSGGNGSQGAQGAQGVPGGNGSPGSQGAQGAQGYQGAKGAQGDTGINGNPGQQGPQGPQGVAGTNGTNGTQGPQGATGADSTIPGPQGPQGNVGQSGNQGSQGVAGVKGDKGDPGQQGPQGAQGYQGAAGATGTPLAWAQEMSFASQFIPASTYTTITSYTASPNQFNTPPITYSNGVYTVSNNTGAPMMIEAVLNVAGNIFNAGNTFCAVIAGANSARGSLIGSAGASATTIVVIPNGGTANVYGQVYVTDSSGLNVTGRLSIRRVDSSGPQGSQGAQGLQGPQGDFGGPQGTQGAQGPQGTQGVSGASSFWYREYRAEPVQTGSYNSGALLKVTLWANRPEIKALGTPEMRVKSDGGGFEFNNSSSTGIIVRVMLRLICGSFPSGISYISLIETPTLVESRGDLTQTANGFALLDLYVPPNTTNWSVGVDTYSLITFNTLSIDLKYHICIARIM